MWLALQRQLLDTDNCTGPGKGGRGRGRIILTFIWSSMPDNFHSAAFQFNITLLNKLVSFILKISNNKMGAMALVELCFDNTGLWLRIKN